MKKFTFLGLTIVLLLGGWFWFVSTYQEKQGSDAYRAKSTVFADALLIENSSIEDAYVYLVFPSGEAANPFDEGLAHYVEHLAWLSAFGEDQEGNDRHSNAWTNHFSTGYWQRAPEGDIESALLTLVSVSEPLSVETEFALQERAILLREYDFRVSERPLYPELVDMDRVIYGDGNLARSVIGAPSDIANYSLDDAKALHEQSHILSNATLLVYGNVGRARFEAALASLSSSIGQQSELEDAHVDLVDRGVVADRSVASVANLGADTILYRKLVPLSSCDTTVQCAMIVWVVENSLNSALPGGLAGPLRYDAFIAREFSFDITLIGNEYAEIAFTGHPDSGVALIDLERAFLDALHATLENGLTQETFERVLSRAKGNLDSILDRERPAHNLDLTLGQLAKAQPIYLLADQMNAIEFIRLEDVNNLLKSLLAEGREVTRLVTVER